MKFLIKFQWPISITLINENHKIPKSVEALNQARQILKPPCVICGEQVPLGRKKLCTEKCAAIYDATRKHKGKHYKRKPKCDMCGLRAKYLTPPRCKPCYMKEYYRKRNMMLSKPEDYQNYPPEKDKPYLEKIFNS